MRRTVSVSRLTDPGAVRGELSFRMAGLFLGVDRELQCRRHRELIGRRAGGDRDTRGGPAPLPTVVAQSWYHPNRELLMAVSVSQFPAAQEPLSTAEMSATAADRRCVVAAVLPTNPARTACAEEAIASPGAPWQVDLLRNHWGRLRRDAAL